MNRHKSNIVMEKILPLLEEKNNAQKTETCYSSKNEEFKSQTSFFVFHYFTGATASQQLRKSDHFST